MPVGDLLATLAADRAQHCQMAQGAGISLQTLVLEISRPAPQGPKSGGLVRAVVVIDGVAPEVWWGFRGFELRDFLGRARGERDEEICVHPRVWILASLDPKGRGAGSRHAGRRCRAYVDQRLEPKYADIYH